MLMLFYNFSTILRKRCSSWNTSDNEHCGICQHAFFRKRKPYQGKNGKRQENITQVLDEDLHIPLTQLKHEATETSVEKPKNNCCGVTRELDQKQSNIRAQLKPQSVGKDTEKF